MSKALIIAEKPSVAADIAQALGGFQRMQKGEQRWYEREDLVLTSAYGHLVELICPAEQEVGYDLARLPMIPQPFGLKPVDKTKSQLALIKQLAGRADVGSLINACDAGREGELIYRYISAAIGSRKPFTRMWLQSMTADAIRAAYNKQRTAQEMQGLYDSARCRSESDWLIGINGTRVLSQVREYLSGQRDTHTTGRVQGPTLALTVDREEQIRTFVPKDYWEVQAVFTAHAGSYDGKWFDPAFKRPEQGEGDIKADRLWSAAEAQAIAERCRGQQATEVREDSKPDTKVPPQLFDLTALQREANSKFGLSAAATLKIAQALYEKHKALTYPRTDANVLPDDYIETVRTTLGSLGDTPLGKYAKETLEKGYVQPNKRIFDSEGISDHFAIIPTGTLPQGLTADESKIYDLVSRRFIAAFFPPAQYLKTVRTTILGGDHFRSYGSVMLDAGWQAVYGKDVKDKDVSLCKVAPGETPEATEVKAVGLKTKAPDRYNDATLLAAMEHAGRTMTDSELRNAMSGKGLGTPATRAATIEKLLEATARSSPYLVREGKELVPQKKAMDTVAFLRRVGVAALTSAEMTAEWEHQLKLMEHGKVQRAQFMSEITEQTRLIVERIRSEAQNAPAAAVESLSEPCPKCGGAVTIQAMAYGCACGLRISRVIAKRKMEQGEVEGLLRDRETPVLAAFISKAEKPFSAILKFSDDLSKLDFVFPERAGASAAAAPSGESLGQCPKCGGGVHMHGEHYFCENNKSGGERSCDFKVSGEILERQIEPETVKVLLDVGRTALLNGFKSKKSGKPFSAYLVRQPDHQVKFEFEN